MTRRNCEPAIHQAPPQPAPRLRAERGLSRRDLAQAAGVNPQTIGFMERGDHNPSLELALDLCEVFALPVEAVFSREPLGPLSALLYATREATAP